MRQRQERLVTTRRVLAFVAGTCVLAGALVYYLNVRGEAPLADDTAAQPSQAAEIERGRYLVTAGDCIACHTARGGRDYAGGRAIETPFGNVYSSNITPDAATGIGAWSRAEFWRALHNGRSKDGRLLYPAFPYPNFTLVTRADADAMYAFLRTLPPVEQRNRAHELRFPYDSALALAVWRALFFRPGEYVSNTAQAADWNRGAYLVRGLGHCDACHSERNALGAVSHPLELGGGLIALQNWYAPPLTSANGPGIADWDSAHVVAYLQTGISPRGAASGPMAEVVYRSTQHLAQRDLAAIAGYLSSLPRSTGDSARASASVVPDPAARARGEQIYADHCATCHGADGAGAPPVYPALAGNRNAGEGPPANAIHAVVNGGFPPVTAGNPRPYGMPPYFQVLDEAAIAAVVTYIRTAWGNNGTAVSTFDVQRYR
jgi:mono/diheme cytochrome c family protein